MATIDISIGYDVADDERRKALRTAIEKLGNAKRVQVYDALKSQYLVRFDTTGTGRRVTIEEFIESLRELLEGSVDKRTDSLLLNRATEVKHFGVPIAAKLRTF